MLEFEIVMANGTLLHLTNQSDPFLMRAMRISVGKLGIITRLKLMYVCES